jgi:hypothetical protein
MSYLVARFYEPSSEQEREELNTYLGIVESLDDPFNLFLRLDDLLSTFPKRRYIYLMAYSLGRKKLILWGVYDRERDEIVLDGACQYRVPQLMSIVKQWKENQYEYVSNQVRDRIKQRLEEYLNLPSESPHIRTYSDYVNLKYLLGYFDGKVTESELNPDLLDNFYTQFESEVGLQPISENYDFALVDYIDSLRREISTYENSLNRTDIRPDLIQKVDRDIMALVVHISQLFLKTLARGNLSYYHFPICPDRDFCRSRQKYEPECELYDYGIISFHPGDF